MLRPDQQRRRFLRSVGVGLGLGASAMLPSFAHAQPRAGLGRGAPPLRIALVLPRTSRFADAGMSQLIGAQLAAQSGAALVSPIWYEQTKQAEKAIHEIVANDQADAVVAAISRAEATQFGALLATHEIPLIVNDAGATMIRVNNVHPYVFRNSLGHWQASWALGQWAAGHGKHAVIASSFYDSGFDTVYAFWEGFERAGGQRPSVAVTHLPYRKTAEDALTLIHTVQPDVVFAAYSGAQATEFARGYATLPIWPRPQLLTSSFFGYGLSNQAYEFPEFRRAQTWLGQHNAENIADPFAALGHDSVNLLVAASQNGERKQQLRNALALTTIEGARGSISFNPHSLETLSPILLNQVLGGRVAHAVEDITTFAAQPLAVPAGPRGGWKNAYLYL